MKVITSSSLNRRGFLATVAALTGGALLAGERSISGLITNTHQSEIDTLRTVNEGEDLRAKERKLAERYWPTVRQRASEMYKAEREDNEKLKKGLIKPEDCRVRISHTEYIPKEKAASDHGTSENFHVVKYYDFKNENSELFRIYVNEHWPLEIKDKKDSLELTILPPESYRFSVQVFSGKLSDPDAEKYFVRDMVHAFWVSSFGGGNDYPEFFRQDLYTGTAHYNDKTRKYTYDEEPIFNRDISTTLCTGCHLPGEAGYAVRKYLNPHATNLESNYSALTPDEDFDNVKPYSQHTGYRELMSYLSEKVGYDVEPLIGKKLEDRTMFENPSIVEKLKNTTTVPFIGEDKKLNEYGSTTADFEYTRDGTRYMKRQAEVFGKDTFLFDGWWDRNSLAALRVEIPIKVKR